MFRIKYVIFFFLTITLLYFAQGVIPSHAQETPTPTPTPTTGPTPTPDNSGAINDLQNKIKDYQSKINDLQSQEKTLSSQIGIMNNQISLTQLKIQAAKAQLAQMEKDIEVTKKRTKDLEKNISATTKALIGRIGATYQVGRIDPWQVFLTSNNITNFLTRLTYLRLVQANDKKNIYAAQQNKANYESEKNVLEEKQQAEEVVKKELEGYTTQLNQDKAVKQALLDVTKGNAANYQKLLAAAQTQLSGFAKFATTQGGASILPAQASPDGWYYNQRDERWGNNSIGTSGEPVWKYGCLMTSVAMVLKQRGESVTPAEVAGNSSYFFQAYMLIPWAGRFTSVWGNDLGSIDSKLSSGQPVIVGLTAGQYGTHFIVLKSGSGGSYIMNDPWYGPNLEFSSHYSTSQIFQYGWFNG